jgi:hypothetical protein
MVEEKSDKPELSIAEEYALMEAGKRLPRSRNARNTAEQ